MKKIYTITIILAAGLIITFLSCTKENQTVNNSEECVSCYEGKILAHNINQFKERLQATKNNPKSGDVMTLDEAIENMELLINASHGFPFEDYNKRQVDIVSFQLPTDGEGNVSMSDVNTAYDEMINLVRDAYINTGFDNKGLILVTLSINEEIKSGETINAKVVTGKSGEGTSDIFSDCWYYGEDLGMCDGTYYLEMDGGDTIANAINANNPINDYHDCPGENYHIVLDPQPYIFLEGYEYEDNNGYLIFFYPDYDGNGFTDEEKKLYADDMNFYYYNEYEVIFTIIPQEYNYTFPNYVLVSCEIDGNNETINNIPTLHHKNELTYALRYWVEDGIIPPPVPID